MTDEQFDKLPDTAPSGYGLFDAMYANVKRMDSITHETLSLAYEAKRAGLFRNVELLELDFGVIIKMLDEAKRYLERRMREQPHETEERDND